MQFIFSLLLLRRFKTKTKYSPLHFEIGFNSQLMRHSFQLLCLKNYDFFFHFIKFHLVRVLLQVKIDYTPHPDHILKLIEKKNYIADEEQSLHKLLKKTFKLKRTRRGRRNIIQMKFPNNLRAIMRMELFGEKKVSCTF